MSEPIGYVVIVDRPGVGRAVLDEMYDTRHAADKRYDGMADADNPRNGTGASVAVGEVQIAGAGTSDGVLMPSDDTGQEAELR